MGRWDPNQKSFEQYKIYPSKCKHFAVFTYLDLLPKIYYSFNYGKNLEHWKFPIILSALIANISIHRYIYVYLSNYLFIYLNINLYTFRLSQID